MSLNESIKQLYKVETAVKIAILVSALGYFVDVYDLLIFNVVRHKSLLSLGFNQSEVFIYGTDLLNIQMLGMILGGIIWGIIGDKVGRLQVLFGSIFLYSIANISNGFVTNLTQYELCRFLAGIGLAGEIGGGLILVAELLPQNIRGLGTTIFASLGVLGGVMAGLVGEYFDWRTSYIIGGVMGILLLFLRISVKESSIFENLKRDANIKRGSLFLLFKTKDRLIRYLSCIILVSPLWITALCLASYAPELTKSLGFKEPVSPGTCVIYYTLGMAMGDFSSGLISQFLESRKKVLFMFLTIFTLSISAIFLAPIETANYYYLLMVPVGFGIGFWTILLTTSAEQFGTNIRATAATTIPNIGRATAIPISLSVRWLEPQMGIANGIIVVSFTVIILCFMAVSLLKETFSRDLNYTDN